MKHQLKLKNTDIKQFNTKNTKNSGTWPGNTDQITNTKFALKKHPTKAYKYDICKVQNNVCPHSTFKYANCEENHRAPRIIPIQFLTLLTTPSYQNSAILSLKKLSSQKRI